MREFLTEGSYINTAENTAHLKDIESITACIGTDTIIEAVCTACDDKHNLTVDLNGIKGVIAREEGAMGIAEGTTRDIALLTKVGKPICFYVKNKVIVDGKPVFELSRRAVQVDCMEQYINKLENGTVIKAKVTYLAPFGAFVDVGVGIASLVPIDKLSVSRISSPSDRLSIGQSIYAIVMGRADGKLQLSMKELLGTWQENADMFEVGSTVVGVVRSVESYGIFIELAPNLAGLAEVKDDIKVGQYVSVFVKAIIPEKCKVKLVIVDTLPNKQDNADIKYFITEGKLTEWNYTTEGVTKQIKTVF